VSDTITTASTKSSKVAEKVAEKVVDNIPAVVETVEVALEVPAKLAVKTPLIVVVSVLGGAALGAGGLWAVNKWRARKDEQVDVPDDISSLDDEAKKA
jgi:hypothetical protein